MNDGPPRDLPRRAPVIRFAASGMPLDAHWSASSGLDDGTLVAALAREDLYALETLYARYSRLVYAVSLRVLRDASLAEDVVQEVFLRLWRQPASYDPARGRFTSWLASVTRNRSVDELRRVSRRLHSERTDEAMADRVASTAPCDDPAASAELAEARAAVRAAMTRLPPAQRRVIELAYFGGLTQVEIAAVTGEPLGTVKTRVRLGMHKLRDSLAPYVQPERATPPDAREA